MTQRLRSALESLKRKRETDERRVLARAPSYCWDRNQGRVTDRTLQNWMELIEQRAGIEDGTGRLHIPRHTFRSLLAEAGAPAGNIQRLAGHASITTAERYMHYSEEGKERAIALLDGVQVHCIGVANEQGSRRSPVVSSS
jgi:integrase